jgi:hypothetical protein
MNPPQGQERTPGAALPARHEVRQAPPTPLGDLATERALLAALLRAPAALAAAVPHVRAEDFYDPTHGQLFAAATALHAQRTHVDAVTLGAAVGHAVVDRVIGHLPVLVDPAGAASYAALVADTARTRRLAAQLAQACTELERGTPRAKVATDLDAALTGARLRAEATPLALVLEGLLEAWDHPLPCTPTGLHQLDALLAGGLRPGDLIGVAGTAGGGKSALVGQIGLDAAQAGAVVLYASVEMAPAEVLARWLACVAFRGVPPELPPVWALGYADILYGRAWRGEDARGRPILSPDVRAQVFDRLECARQALEGVVHRLFVEQIEPGATVEQVAALVRSARRQAAAREPGAPHPVVVVVDPLQRLFASERAGRTGRAAEAVNGLETERVGAVAQELKYLADTEGLAVLFTSDTTKSAALAPVSSASSLRGSYQINHLATLVLGLHTAETAAQLRAKLGDLKKPDAVAPELTEEEIQRRAAPGWWGHRADATSLGARLAVLECSKNRRGRPHALALGFVPGATCFVEGDPDPTDDAAPAASPPRRNRKVPGGPP